MSIVLQISTMHLLVHFINKYLLSSNFRKYDHLHIPEETEYLLPNHQCSVQCLGTGSLSDMREILFS
jgi:hypothetical protein